MTASIKTFTNSADIADFIVSSRMALTFEQAGEKHPFFDLEGIETTEYSIALLLKYTPEACKQYGYHAKDVMLELFDIRPQRKVFGIQHFVFNENSLHNDKALFDHSASFLAMFANKNNPYWCNLVDSYQKNNLPYTPDGLKIVRAIKTFAERQLSAGQGSGLFFLNS